ncbi:MAG: glycoside hydrolase family 3 N-terminal domain-containing protein, partial [Bacteroidota bacterium]
MQRIFFLFLLLPLFAGNCVSQTQTERERFVQDSTRRAEALRQRLILEDQHRTAWANSLLDTLTLDQKIGQLFMVAAYSNRDENHTTNLERMIADYHLGGLIFFQGTPRKQIEMINRFQTKSDVPLMIGIDGEWGLGMRLDNTISYPRQMILGATNDDSLIYAFGQEVGRQCKRVGVHVNFAPVVDVNSNPKNPVIGTRSFGENKERVARLGTAYAKGMQSVGVLANAKHFPGHGDTDKDSHLTLPSVLHDKKRMSDIELFPFRALIRDSVESMMVAHLNIPAYDSTENRPTTLSPAVVNGLLRDSLGFQGLVFTDAMNMKGLANNAEAGSAEVQALQAGNDVLLYPLSVPKAIMAIKKALKDSTLSYEDLDNKVRRILRAKYFAGLHQPFQKITTDSLYQNLHTPHALRLEEELYEKAVTIVKNDCELLPFKDLDSLDFASLVIHNKPDNTFQTMLSKYASFSHHAMVSKNSSQAFYDKVYDKVKDRDVVVVGLFGVNQYQVTESMGVMKRTCDFLDKLALKTKVVLVVFGNPYSLKFFENQNYLVAAYSEHELMQQAVPQVLFGAVTNKATLPVSPSAGLPEGTGNFCAYVPRLRHTRVPESVGVSSEVLAQVDEIAEEGIKKKAYPGCQVVGVKDGVVFLNRNYGHYTYEQKVPVSDASVYDLASLTKVLATLPTVMQLYDDSLISMDERVSEYLPELKETNKKYITLRQVLCHQAGLQSHMPGWHETFGEEELFAKYYQTECSEEFGCEVTEAVFAPTDIEETLWSWVRGSQMRRLRSTGYGYKYSDMGFFILKKMIESLTGQSMDRLAESRFYRSMGMDALSYRPLWNMNKERVVPTEDDGYFRR